MKNAFILAATTALAAGAAHAQATDAVEARPEERAISAIASFEAGGYTSTDGETLYRTLCAGCHMPDGAGAEGAGVYPALSGNPNLEYAAYPISIIVNGQGGMPSLGHLLDDAQVLAVTSYIQSGLDNGYEPDGTVAAGGRHPPRRAGGGSGRARGRRHGYGRGAAAETGAAEGGVVRHPIPGSDFPILMAAEIPADATLVYLSGTVPQVVDDSAAEGAPERFGDTAAQTVSTFESIAEKLASLDLGMGDVVKMQVYLVAPEGSEGMDFGGFMDGYVQFFGTGEQPNLPTRSVFEVAGLANPSWLVEIEVVAVRD